MKSIKDPSGRDRWARLRFSIIGPLLAAPAQPGELQTALALLAAKTWRHPTSNLDVSFGLSTLERWYYAARKADDPVAALKDRLRGGINRFPSLSPLLVDTLTLQYREHPGWTAQLHFDNLCAALKGSASQVPSYPTIRRYLKAKGMFRQAQPKRATAGALAARDRLERLEVRSFEVDHVGALWHLDFHHGSRKVLTRLGEWVTPMILCVIDDRSRLVCHLQWYLDETAQSLIHALCQAFMKRGLPRALMTDNGAAMLAEETTTGLAALGIVHQTTLPYSPYQYVVLKNMWRPALSSVLLGTFQRHIWFRLQPVKECHQIGLFAPRHSGSVLRRRCALGQCAGFGFKVGLRVDVGSGQRDMTKPCPYRIDIHPSSK